jgi:hypothetical protein
MRPTATRKAGGCDSKPCTLLEKFGIRKPENTEAGARAGFCSKNLVFTFSRWRDRPTEE